MDRVSSAGYQVIGGHRTFQNKNLGAGQQGTTFDQVWFSGAQECIIAVYEQLGITPADQAVGSVDQQLLQAVRRIAAGNSVVLTSPTTTLLPDNAGLVLIDATLFNQTITMPLAGSSNRQMLEFNFVRLDSTSNTVTVYLAGSDTTFPTGLAPFSIAGPGSLSLKGDGISKWVDSAALNAFLTLGSYTKGGSTSLAFPGASAAAGTVAASGWRKDPSGLITNWVCIQLIDSTNTAWAFPQAFATGVLNFRSQNVCYAAGQSIPANAGLTDLVSTNGTTTATFVCHNTGTPGTLCAFILEAEGY